MLAICAMTFLVAVAARAEEVGERESIVLYICPLHSDVVFADDGEGWEEVGHDEEVSDFFADVAEFDLAAFGAGGDVEADERAEAHAVHVLRRGYSQRVERTHRYQSVFAPDKLQAFCGLPYALQ
jgi:hypothetical protein